MSVRLLLLSYSGCIHRLATVWIDNYTKQQKSIDKIWLVGRHLKHNTCPFYFGDVNSLSSHHMQCSYLIYSRSTVLFAQLIHIPFDVCSSSTAKHYFVDGSPLFAVCPPSATARCKYRCEYIRLWSSMINTDKHMPHHKLECKQFICNAHHIRICSK